MPLDSVPEQWQSNDVTRFAIPVVHIPRVCAQVCLCHLCAYRYSLVFSALAMVAGVWARKTAMSRPGLAGRRGRAPSHRRLRFSAPEWRTATSRPANAASMMRWSAPLASAPAWRCASVKRSDEMSPSNGNRGPEWTTESVSETDVPPFA